MRAGIPSKPASVETTTYSLKNMKSGDCVFIFSATEQTTRHSETKMNRNIALASSVLLLTLVGRVAGGVVTNVAPSGAIIDSSGSIDDLLTPARVLDRSVNEAPGVPASYWLGPAGATNAYFILDLRRDYTVKSVDLYNTHNRGANDSGTARFALTASDAIGPNSVSLDRYYPLNGDVNDQSPNAVHGMAVDTFLSPIDAVYSSDVPAKLTGDTKSISLSGDGESIEIPDPEGFQQPAAYSYALWVKFLTNDVQPALRGTSLVLRTGAAGAEKSTWSHSLRLNANSKFEAYAWIGLEATVTGTTTVQPNVWYHVACTAQNDGLMHLYVNGVEEGTPFAITALWTGGTLTEVGTGSGGGDFQPAAELIDDLGIWYSALTPDRIKSLSEGKSPLTVGGAKGYVLLDPKSVVAGTLSDVGGQAQIAPTHYDLSTPITARYFRFDALSLIGTNAVGLNELQLTAEVETPVLTTAPAVELTWPPTPFAQVPSSGTSLVSSNWAPLTASPSLIGDNFTVAQEATNAAVFYRLAGPSAGGTVTTNVAKGAVVLSASSTYNSQFEASHVLDGSLDESTNAPVSFWIASDGVTEADFILDLRRSYSIKSFALYNTHNRQFNDRGTAQYELYAFDGFGTNQTQSANDRYYSFNGALTDQSGQGVDAVLLDGPDGNAIEATYTNDVPTGVSGKQSIVFSDSGARLEILDVDPATQPTAYSVSMWVKFSDLSKPSSLILRTAGSGQEMTTWSHQLRVTSVGQFQVYAFDGATPTVTGSTVAQLGVWYHVVATAQNGGLMHLYVNGNEEGTPVKVGALWNGGARWTMGTGSGNGYNPLMAEVSDLALWFAPLTAEAVEALSAGTKPTTVKATTATVQPLNSRVVASGSLSDVTAQDSIVPDVNSLTSPVTTRFLQFKALSSIYGGNVGLNEIQVMADASGTKLAITPAVVLTWDYSPLNMVLQSSPDGTNWTPVTEPASLSGATYKLIQPAGRQYRLIAQ